MSVSKLNAPHCRGHLLSPCMTHVQKRFAHRSADYHYLQTGMQKSRYNRIFDESTSEMQQFPEFMERYFKVATVMKCKKMIPLVHAQSAMYRVPSLFIRALNIDGEKQGFFKYLRPPTQEFNLKREELIQRVEAYCKTHGEIAYTPGVWNADHSRLDSHPALKSHLVSASYSLMDFSPYESAAWFLFRNSNVTRVDDRLQTANQAIERSLRMYGLESKTSTVLKSLEPVYAEYEKLKLGTLYVIGVPEEKIDRFAYDSKSFGVPSRNRISDVVRDLGNSPRAHSDEEGGLQARLLMYRETLDPSSGIQVVDVNTDREAEDFCRGFDLDAPASVFKHTRIFEKRMTEVERDNARRQKLLDEQVQNLALSLKKSVSTL